jgi:hypothetical protein
MAMYNKSALWGDRIQQSFVKSGTITVASARVRAIFVTLLLRLALRKFITLMGIRESS